MKKWKDKVKRKIINLKLVMHRNGWKKAKFLKKKNVFGAIGENCYYHPNILPSEPFLVFFGNNVIVAANVRFVTHSAHHLVFNQEDNVDFHKTMFGEIKIGNNVFIGANSIIMYGVEIGDNVIIGAGSIVTKKVLSDSVVAGVPAKKIGTYSGLKEKSKEYSSKFKNVSSNMVLDLYNYNMED